MGCAPVHDAAKLVPVVYLFEIEMFYWSSGDYKTVVELILYVVEGLVECQHVLLGCVLGCVSSGGNKFQIYLQRGVAQDPCELGLGVDFYRHKIQKQYLQRTDILGHSPGLGHEEDVFFFQYFRCRQLVWNLYRHVIPF